MFVGNRARVCVKSGDVQMMGADRGGIDSRQGVKLHLPYCVEICYTGVLYGPRKMLAKGI